MSAAPDSLFVVEDWESPLWRLDHLYSIVDDEGNLIPFRLNPEQRDFFQNLWTWNLILKARQLGFCVSPETRVLTADLRWVAIAELQPGQEVVAVDEFPPGGRGKSRRMRTATVNAVARVHRMAYRITFDDGRQVVCTDRHPWLSKKAGDLAEWRSLSGQGNAVVGRLKVGTKVRWVTRPWGEPDAEDGWFGGMLDGEGSMALPSRNGASVNVSQRPGPVWDRLVSYAQARGYLPRTEADGAARASKHGRTPVPKLVFTRMDEIFRLIGQTRPVRFVGRRFWEGRELPGKRNGDIGWATITGIEEVGEQDMIDLQTSTGTYIAEGFVSHNTTVIDLMALDQCLFNANFSAGVIAHNLDDANKIFRNKIKTPYEKLPEALREKVPLASSTMSELVFANGSSIGVGTSMRSGTLQFLHISEFGKICSKFPDKAKEIVTGSFPTLKAGQFLFVESTAEGQEGYFYEFVRDALAAQREGAKQTVLDFRLHFYAWWQKPANTLDPDGVVIDGEMAKYFFRLEKDHGIRLSPEQKAWYVKTEAKLKGDMKREHPSYPEEAFEVAIDGVIYARELELMRRHGQITDVPWDPSLPVNTFWDLGLGDAMSLWFHQRVGMQNRLIRYFEDAGEGLSYYVNEIRSHGYTMGTHYLPHDADNRLMGENVETTADILRRLLPGQFVVVDRIREIKDGLNKTREFLPSCWIDRTNCAAGIKALDSYRYEWDEKLGRWKNHPLHNWASHAADALRQGAQGFKPLGAAEPGGFTRHRSSWRA